MAKNSAQPFCQVAPTAEWEQRGLLHYLHGENGKPLPADKVRENIAAVSYLCSVPQRREHVLLAARVATVVNSTTMLRAAISALDPWSQPSGSRVTFSFFVDEGENGECDNDDFDDDNGKRSFDDLKFVKEVRRINLTRRYRRLALLHKFQDLCPLLMLACQLGHRETAAEIAKRLNQNRILPSCVRNMFTDMLTWIINGSRPDKYAQAAACIQLLFEVLRLSWQDMQWIKANAMQLSYKVDNVPLFSYLISIGAHVIWKHNTGQRYHLSIETLNQSRMKRNLDVQDTQLATDALDVFAKYIVEYHDCWNVLAFLLTNQGIHQALGNAARVNLASKIGLWCTRKSHNGRETDKISEKRTHVFESVLLPLILDEGTLATMLDNVLNIRPWDPMLNLLCEHMLKSGHFSSEKVLQLLLKFCHDCTFDSRRFYVEIKNDFASILKVVKPLLTMAHRVSFLRSVSTKKMRRNGWVGIVKLITAMMSTEDIQALNADDRWWVQNILTLVKQPTFSKSVVQPAGSRSWAQVARKG